MGRVVQPSPSPSICSSSGIFLSDRQEQFVQLPWAEGDSVRLPHMLPQPHAPPDKVLVLRVAGARPNVRNPVQSGNNLRDRLPRPAVIDVEGARTVEVEVLRGERALIEAGY